MTSPMRPAPRRAAVRGATAVLALTIGATVGPLAAAAPAAAPATQNTTTSSPPEQGWWTTTNPGGGLPAVPQTDVPEDGLLAEGGPETPSALAALSFSVPATSGVDLQLSVAEGSGTTPGAVLRLCALTGSFEPVQGGPMADAPEYDCERTVDMTPSGGTNPLPVPAPDPVPVPPAGAITYVADVSSLLSDGGLRVALLSASPDARIVLEKPGSDAISAGQGEGSAPETLSPPSDFGEGSEPSSGGFDVAGSGSPAVSDGFAVAALEPALPPEAPATAVLPEAAQPLQPPDQSITFNTTPAAQSSGRGGLSPRTLLVLFGGLAAAAVVLWAFAGGSGGAASTPGSTTAGSESAVA